MRSLSRSYSSPFLLIFLVTWIVACESSPEKWAGQAPIRVVSTDTRPIQKQASGITELGQGIFVSNDFEGARLNGSVLQGDTLIDALITPENTPINPSPWYSFKVWSEAPREISVRINYLDGVYHRYYPKLSRDGETWSTLDSSRYSQGEEVVVSESGRELPLQITINVDIGPDTLWISAQELMTSSRNWAWIQGLDALPYVQHEQIGESREGRPVRLMKIGESDDSKMIFVLSRQHPPEVTGYLAMISFVETLAGTSELAQAFRGEYNAYVVPMANPDGVDNGQWRHSLAGIDLNRDWKNVNQPEIQAIQEYMGGKLENGGKVYFGVDFHSTWEDIYYTINEALKGNKPGLVPEMITSMAAELELDPNIRPGRDTLRGPTSSSYMFHVLGAEALTFEFGDNTPRDLIKRKGEVSAEKLMELLLETSE